MMEREELDYAENYANVSRSNAQWDNSGEKNEGAEEKEEDDECEKTKKRM